MPLQHVSSNAWVLYTLSSRQPLLCSSYDTAAAAVLLAATGCACCCLLPPLLLLLLLFLRCSLITSVRCAARCAAAIAAAVLDVHALESMHQVEDKRQVVPGVIVIAPHQVSTSL
jgi:hypothetical protein